MLTVSLIIIIPYVTFGFIKHSILSSDKDYQTCLNDLQIIAKMTELKFGAVSFIIATNQCNTRNYLFATQETISALAASY